MKIMMAMAIIVIMTMIGSWSHAHCRGIAALQQLATPTAPIVHCAHHGDGDDDDDDDYHHDSAPCR